MTDRFSLVARRIVIVAGVLSLTPAGLVAAQTPAGVASAARQFVPPKTPWGEPDLQGLYSNKTITPLERPAQFAGQAELTDQEIADLENRAATPNMLFFSRSAGRS